MAPAPITVPDVEEAVRHALSIGRRSIDDVASLLFISKSTLQRLLKASETDFTAVRQRVQIEIALRRLSEGASAATVASEVGLSRDYLCVLVREAAELTPNQIIRAKKLADTVARWRRHGPPEAWSPLYYKQRRQWRRVDDELERLLADLGPSHPLATWAKRLLVAADRPDFRRQPYRDEIRAQRRAEAEQLTATLNRATEVLRRVRTTAQPAEVWRIFPPNDEAGAEGVS